ncbi:MAG: hypothetical protein K0U15_05925, partial [Proteobacteria bacterium]|nr:hypothetical protein [Pseudomonadota bacterium]
NISVADAAKFSLSVNGNFVYLIDQTFINDGGAIGTEITLTVLLTDDVVAATSALATQRIQLTGTLFSAEFNQWFATLTTGSQRSFGNITLANVAGSVSYTLLDGAVGTLAIDDNGIVSITANITSATALTFSIAVADDLGYFSSTVTLGGTLHLTDSSVFTPMDQISISVNHLVTQVAGEKNIIISPVVASGGYIGNAQYEFFLLMNGLESIFTLVPGTGNIFTLSILSLAEADLRVSGTLFANSELTATIRVLDLTPDNLIDVLVTLVVNDTLSVENLSLYYWLQPQDIGKTINITTAGGILPLVSLQTAIAPLAASAQLSLTLAGNIIQLIDNDYIANATLGSTLSLSLTVFDSINSSASAEQVEIIVIDAVSLPPTKRLTVEGGAASGSLYTIAASGGLGNYLYQTISVSPEAMATLITLSPGAQGATLSLVGVTLSVETTIQVVVSAADGQTQATQTIDLVVRYKNLTDDSVPGNGRLLVAGGAVENSNFSIPTDYPQDVWAADSVNVDDWETLTTNGYPADYFQAAIFFNGSLYVMGGASSDEVWRSADGVNWSSIGNLPDGKRFFHGIVVLNNKMVLLGGTDSTNNPVIRSTWSSTDGINWQLLAAEGLPPFDHEFAYAVLNNTIYAAGGYNNVSDNRHLWSSSDGIGWSLHSNIFSADNAPTATQGNFAFVFKGSLFIMDTSDHLGQTRKVRYSSTPTDPDSWNIYAHTIEQRRGAKVVVYKDKILVLAGETPSGVNTPLPNIWASTSGTQGSWSKIYEDTTWLGRVAPIAIVLGEEVTPALIPSLAASFISVTGAAISLAIADDGLSATTTITMEYSGALVAISVDGGYLDGGNYQFNLTDDSQLFQIDANGEISIAANVNYNGKTLGLTVVVNDQYAGNDASTPTLILSMEILPRLSLDSGEEVFWRLESDLGATATMTVIRHGTSPYSATLSNISATDAAKFSLSVNGNFVYLIDQTFISGGTIGTDITLTVLLVDDVVA